MRFLQSCLCGGVRPYEGQDTLTQHTEPPQRPSSRRADGKQATCVPTLLESGNTAVLQSSGPLQVLTEESKPWRPATPQDAPLLVNLSMEKLTPLALLGGGTFGCVELCRVSTACNSQSPLCSPVGAGRPSGRQDMPATDSGTFCPRTSAPTEQYSPMRSSGSGLGGVMLPRSGLPPLPPHGAAAAGSLRPQMRIMVAAEGEEDMLMPRSSTGQHPSPMAVRGDATAQHQAQGARARRAPCSPFRRSSSPSAAAVLRHGRGTAMVDGPAAMQRGDSLPPPQFVLRRGCSPTGSGSGTSFCPASPAVFTDELVVAVKRVDYRPAQSSSSDGAGIPLAGGAAATTRAGGAAGSLATQRPRPCGGSPKVQARLKRMQAEELAQLVRCRDSPFIVRVFGCVRAADGDRLVMEWAEGGDLGALIERLRRHRGPHGHQLLMSEASARYYMACLLQALHFLHSHGIMHRDVKPDNLLLTSSGLVKLGDLGMASHMDPTGKATGRCGTPNYMAPEVWAFGTSDATRYYTSNADLWSAGVALFEMLTGRLPVEHPDAYLRRGWRLTFDSGRGISGGADAAQLSPALRDLLHRMLCPKPRARLRSVQAAMAHPWFKGFDWAGLQSGALEAPYVPSKHRPPPLPPPHPAAAPRSMRHSVLCMRGSVGGAVERPPLPMAVHKSADCGAQGAGGLLAAAPRAATLVDERALHAPVAEAKCSDLVPQRTAVSATAFCGAGLPPVLPARFASANPSLCSSADLDTGAGAASARTGPPLLLGGRTSKHTPPCPHLQLPGEEDHDSLPPLVSCPSPTTVPARTSGTMAQQLGGMVSWSGAATVLEQWVDGVRRSATLSPRQQLSNAAQAAGQALGGAWEWLQVQLPPQLLQAASAPLQHLATAVRQASVDGAPLNDSGSGSLRASTQCAPCSPAPCASACVRASATAAAEQEVLPGSGEALDDIAQALPSLDVATCELLGAHGGAADASISGLVASQMSAAAEATAMVPGRSTLHQPDTAAAAGNVAMAVQRSLSGPCSSGAQPDPRGAPGAPSQPQSANSSVADSSAGAGCALPAASHAQRPEENARHKRTVSFSFAVAIEGQPAVTPPSVRHLPAGASRGQGSNPAPGFSFDVSGLKLGADESPNALQPTGLLPRPPLKPALVKRNSSPPGGSGRPGATAGPDPAAAGQGLVRACFCSAASDGMDGLSSYHAQMLGCRLADCQGRRQRQQLPRVPERCGGVPYGRTVGRRAAASQHAHAASTLQLLMLLVAAVMVALFVSRARSAGLF